MPIDAVLKDLLEPAVEWSKTKEPGQERGIMVQRKVKGYTSHLTTCPFKDNAMPENTNHRRQKP